jgi:hypothetical protein
MVLFQKLLIMEQCTQCRRTTRICFH